MATMDSAALAKKEKRMWGLGLDSWYNVLVTFLAIGAVAAAFVGVATYVTLQLQKQETAAAKDDLEKYKIAANEHIAAAQEAGAVAMADAANANARASNSELELARLKAPRLLNAEQIARGTHAMVPFAGKQFDIGIVQGDPEAADLAAAVESTLAGAGLVEINWQGGTIVFTRQGRPTLGNVTLSGVVIQMHPDHIADFAQAADALAKALTDEGVDTRAEHGSGTAATNSNAMHVLIGKKPID